MKKMYLVAFALVSAFALSSCSKDDNNGDGNTGGGNDNVPTSFTQKALVEEFSGAWCGWCVDGAYVLDQMIDNTGKKVVGVTIHYGDDMQIAAFNDLAKVFSVSSFPSGMVARTPSIQDGKVVMSRSYWTSNGNAVLSGTAVCGLKIDATNENDIKVTAGFNSEIDGDIRLTVYVVEDKVTGSGSGYDQHNYYANNANYPNHPFYSQPATIKGYEHNHVLRSVLSSETMGDMIDKSNVKAGGKFEKSYSLKGVINSKSNVSIVAFVNKVGSNATTHQVLNAQVVKLGASQGWD